MNFCQRDVETSSTEWRVEHCHFEEAEEIFFQMCYCFRLKQFNECYFRSNNLRNETRENLHKYESQANFGELIIWNCLNRFFYFTKKVFKKNGKKNEVELQRITVWLWMENHRHECPCPTSIISIRWIENRVCLKSGLSFAGLCQFYKRHDSLSPLMSNLSFLCFEI